MFNTLKISRTMNYIKSFSFYYNQIIAESLLGQSRKICLNELRGCNGVHTCLDDKKCFTHLAHLDY